MMKTELRTEQEIRNELASLYRRLRELERQGDYDIYDMVYEQSLTLEWALGLRGEDKWEE